MFLILILCVFFFFQERCWFETVFPEEFTRFSEGNYSPSQSYSAVKCQKSENCIIIFTVQSEGNCCAALICEKTSKLSMGLVGSESQSCNWQDKDKVIHRALLSCCERGTALPLKPWGLKCKTSPWCLLD